MSCKSCNSDNKHLFSAEVAIHFPGHKGWEMPLILVFPKLTVCLECGLAEFDIPERELRALKEGEIDAA